MIPETTLNQIQERVDIVEVIGSRVQLRRVGKNFKANCPFHQEKTPSFMVNPDKQIFHCFGCGVGGNIFTFLMKFEKKDFREAAEVLANYAGIEIPKEKTLDSAREARIAELIKIHGAASEFYQRVLWSEKISDKAKEYLRARGLAEQTIKDFQLGLAPDAWDSLIGALKSEFSEKTLEKSGLILQGKEGKYYDRFRKRIIFPILDSKGVCVAFGARVLDESLPKYLNSPETEIYTKGKHLYGLHQARSFIRELDSVIVVEGYMDVIGCHQAGVRNAVASLGTALTNEQARLMKRHTSNVFILYDADAAGEAATLRGLEILLEEGMDVKIVRLAQGYDPDSFILKFGIQSFHEQLKAAKNLFEYKVALLKTKHGVGALESRVKIANEMVSLFSKVKNEILRSAWTQELAKDLGLTEASLKAEMGKTGNIEKPAHFIPASASRPASNEIRAAEKILVGLLLENRDFLERGRESLVVEDFQNAALRKIAQSVLFLENPPMNLSGWMNLFREDVESAEIIALSVAEAEKVSDKDKAFEDCLLWMKKIKIEAQRERLQAQIVDAQRLGDSNRIRQLLNDFSELNRGMKKNNEKK